MISANVIIISVAGRLEEIYRAAYEVDFADSFTIRWLLRLRGISSENFSLRGIERSIFRKLGENPGGELVFGLIGRFCTIFGDLEAIRSTPDFLRVSKTRLCEGCLEFFHNRRRRQVPPYDRNSDQMARRSESPEVWPILGADSAV